MIIERESVLNKLRKLKKIAECSTGNLHEVAAAAAKIQEIVAEFQIAEMELNIEQGEPEEDIIIEVLSGENIKFNRIMWQEILIKTLTDVNGCFAIAYKSIARLNIPGKSVVYGTKSNIDTVKYLNMLFTREIERLATLYGIHTGNTGKSEQTSFKTGASSEICARLREAKREVDLKINATGEHTNALVHISKEKEKLDDFVAKKHPKLTKGTAVRFKYNTDAFHAGKAAGSTVQLNANKALNAGKKELH